MQWDNYLDGEICNGIITWLEKYMQDKRVLRELKNHLGEKCLWRMTYLVDYLLEKNRGRNESGKKFFARKM